MCKNFTTKLPRTTLGTGLARTVQETERVESWRVERILHVIWQSVFYLYVAQSL